MLLALLQTLDYSHVAFNRIFVNVIRRGFQAPMIGRQWNKHCNDTKQDASFFDFRRPHVVQTNKNLPMYTEKPSGPPHEIKSSPSPHLLLHLVQDISLSEVKSWTQPQMVPYQVLIFN